MANTKKNKERVIEYLQSAVADGSCGLNNIPALIKTVIMESLWQVRYDKKTRQTVTFTNFPEFVAAPAPIGLGTDLKTLRKLCADNPAVLDLIDQTEKPPAHGGDRRSENFKRDNVPVEISARGNSLKYSLKRLRKLSPELHEAVLHGRLTANKAMIAAGLRSRSIYVSCNDMAKIARKLRANFCREDINRLIKFLMTN